MLAVQNATAAGSAAFLDLFVYNHASFADAIVDCNITVSLSAGVRERERCHENARRLLRCDAVFVRNLTVVCQDRLGTDAENDERMLSQNPGGVRYVFGIWHLAAAAKQLRGATVRRIDETHANPLAHQETLAKRREAAVKAHTNMKRLKFAQAAAATAAFAGKEIKVKSGSVIVTAKKDNKKYIRGASN